MKKCIIRTTALFSFLLIAFTSIETKALDLGLKPSNVFALWDSVNRSMLAYADAAQAPALKTKMAGMAPESFSGKKPGDVLMRVGEFRQRLDLVAAKVGHPATEIFTDPSGAAVTPSVVYVNSGYVLDQLINCVITVDQSIPVTPLYAAPTYSGKTPSDVFGLVDLAVRRMDLILQHMNLKLATLPLSPLEGRV